ncbi:MAG: ABC transporter substrate-binding protein, partial [Proteobacteria bacterium]|nr:ABC transporter substrate-binding protein [Pseudomonadota bacterium]
MKRRTWRIARLVGIVGLLVLLVTGTALGGEKGVTKNWVKVGASLDLTGPIAFVGKSLKDGINVYFSAVNAAGGIHGRKIKLVVEDNGYRPSRAVASVVKLAGRDKVFAIVGTNGTSLTLAMIPAIMREGIPLVGIGAFSPKLANPPRKYVFHVLTNYDDQVRIALDYIVKDLGVKKPKLGIIYQDDDFGQDCLKGLKRQAKMYGIPILAAVSYKRGTLDFNPQVVRMMKAGVKYVFLATIYRETAGVLKTAAKLGFKATFMVTA